MPGTDSARTEGGSFLEHLVRALRGGEGADPSVADFELLGPLVIPASARPVGAVDPDAFWRIEAFFRAAGARIEERTGVVCVPMLRMRREGFGTVVLIAGRLVAVSRWFDDASAFRFDSVEALAVAGERVVQEGIQMIQHHPEVARTGR